MTVGCWFALLVMLGSVVGAILVTPWSLAATPAAVALLLTFHGLRHRYGAYPWRRLRAHLGYGHGIDELARRLDRPAAELRSAAPVYRAVDIPKRRGGTRRLHVPDAATKALQRDILHRLLKRLRAHGAAHAYERGRSIATNAAQHVGRAVVLKMDVVDFFASTSAARVERYFRRIGWNREAAALLTRLTTHEGGLPQGAPTSPRLANLVNRHFDVLIDRTTRRFRGTYTRYADDLTISFPEDWPRKMRGMVQRVRKVAKAFGYRVHGKPKLGIFRAHQRQLVTGLVVNQRVALPRETRRWLRAVKHRARHGKATITSAQIAGWDAYAAMIGGATSPAPGPADRGG